MEADNTDDIESLMEDMDYIPGHFHLKLSLNCDPVGPVRLRHRDTYLKQESLRGELEAEVGHLQYAVRNLLGLLAFHLEQLDMAEETFRSICREDPGNLNAWANLGYVYDRLGRELDAGECVEKVSHLMGLDAGEASQEETRVLAARCLAEQAYVHPYDVELDSEDDLRERLTAALRLYNKALDYGGQLIPMEEKRSWYFKMATIYIRLDDIVKTKEDSEYSRLSHYNKGLKLLKETLKSEKTQHKALAWCYIGILLERKDDFTTVPMSIHDCGYSASDPLSCYGTAINMASDDAFILNLLAKVFFLLGKHEMATGISNMALNVLPDPELNWQAYCTRAKINMMFYIRDLEKAKRGQGGIPDRQLLTDARKDLDKVLSVRPCLRTHLEMAQVYYYMGVDALQESLLVDEAAVNCALVSLSHALQFQLGDSLPDLHVLRGRCLHLKGEDQNAAECFKQAVELERPGSTDTTALRCLLQALLSVFMQGGPDPSTAIGQLEMWVQRAEERYPNDIVKAELRCLYRTQTAEVTELSRALIRAGRLDLVKRLLETIVPKQLAKKKTITRSFSFT
ncbi:tetratricopeptide repeat protein 22 [Hippoglossus hippoglossus]|uniref:tetratricopeptide repeat protein 22 n=1 Tax=Hippoglossus hippoglossus TaxID=8267 RepID=UPI00148BE843|nr:tetratricopeptide repeat protein 22 [Hippoglossus hippoglossus]XP_035031667.1 tetratricopeptide repeat protein 22 [Hippoglossus stenolepis]XP_047199241.1 tetratricopeptide repeat protein 22 [Hippoglossus stenolepis]